MSADQFHQFFLASMLLNILLLIFLFIMEPVLGILWLLMLILISIILLHMRSEVFNAEWKRLIAPFRAFGKRLFGQTEDPIVRNTEFTPEYELIYMHPNGEKHYIVNKEDFLVGRNSQCDARLDGDKAIGREHCRIKFRKYSQEYYIEDLRSRSGTYLGQKRLEPFTQVKLLPNTELTIGNSRLCFKKRQGV